MENIYLMEVPHQEDYDTALKNNILKMDVDRRLRSGWSLKNAITVPLENKTLSERKKMLLLAQKNGISERTFLRRLKNGWTQYDAATKEHSKPGRKAKIT